MRKTDGILSMPALLDFSLPASSVITYGYVVMIIIILIQHPIILLMSPLVTGETKIYGAHYVLINARKTRVSLQ